jgi:hypothetical protein
MEKSNGNILFPSFKSNGNLKKPIAKNNLPIPTNFSGRSNEPFSSIANSNNNTLEIRHNKDIEEIGKMQRLGVLRRISKKDSENIRKNNLIYEQEAIQVLS